MKKTQPWGITYPDSGDSINQAPAQMQAMAESIDTAVGKIANKPPITYAVAKQLDPTNSPRRPTPPPKRSTGREP